MKKLIIFIILALILFTACAKKDEKETLEDNAKEKLNIVTTIFPTYDFAKEIGKDNINAKLLLKPGQESHTYEPTPKDILAIKNADLFVYVGGENDVWVDEILKSMGENKPETLKLLETVPTVYEEIVEGMEDSHNHSEDNHEHSHNEDSEHSHEHQKIDEHVWTSPKNSIIIVEKMAKIFSEKDAKNSQIYMQNSQDYIKKLEDLDSKIKEAISNSKLKTLVFGDRFPFRYFADEYGIEYYAAFSGCSTETEASPKTVAFLIDKIKELNIPAVFSIEFSNEKIAQSIAEATNTKKLQLNSGHNLTKEQLEKGVTYLSLMEENIEILREALN